MTEPGGVSDINVLKFLILYVLKYCEKAVSFTVLNDILMSDGLVDFFEFATALEQLVSTGHVEKTTREGEDFYRYTSIGFEAIALFQRQIPYIIREKSIKTAELVLKRERTENQVIARYKKLPDGSYTVKLSLKENGEYVMSLSFNAPSIEQAKRICENFQTHTSEVFSGIVDSITHDYQAPQE